MYSRKCTYVLRLQIYGRLRCFTRFGSSGVNFVTFVAIYRFAAFSLSFEVQFIYFLRH